MRTIIFLIAIFFSSVVFSGQEVQSSTFIKKRVDAFESIESDLKSLKRQLKGKPVSLKKIKALTMSINQNIKILPDAFAPGTHKGNTRARERIWSNQEDFKARLNALQKHALALDDAAQTENLADILNALKAMPGDCRSCHMRYRELW